MGGGLWGLDLSDSSFHFSFDHYLWRCISLLHSEKFPLFIRYQSNTASAVLETITNIQPKESGGGVGETREAIVYRLSEDMLSKLPPDYIPHEVSYSLPPSPASSVQGCLWVPQRWAQSWDGMFQSLPLSLRSFFLFSSFFLPFGLPYFSQAPWKLRYVVFLTLFSISFLPHFLFQLPFLYPFPIFGFPSILTHEARNFSFPLLPKPALPIL